MRAQGHGFRQMCGEEVPATGIVKRRRDLDSAEAIAIGLQHAGGGSAGSVPIPQQAPVSHDRVQIDLQDGTPVRNGRYLLGPE